MKIEPFLKLMEESRIPQNLNTLHDALSPNQSNALDAWQHLSTEVALLFIEVYNLRGAPKYRKGLEVGWENGFRDIVNEVKRILDGKESIGLHKQPWQTLKERLIQLRKDSEELEHFHEGLRVPGEEDNES